MIGDRVGDPLEQVGQVELQGHTAPLLRPRSPAPCRGARLATVVGRVARRRVDAARRRRVRRPRLRRRRAATARPMRRRGRPRPTASSSTSTSAARTPASSAGVASTRSRKRANRRHWAASASSGCDRGREGGHVHAAAGIAEGHPGPGRRRPRAARRSSTRSSASSTRAGACTTLKPLQSAPTSLGSASPLPGVP